jgi:hypothetical protein
MDAHLKLLEASTQVVEFDGGMLIKGFWLYVWVVTTPDGERLLYVGRTGDNSSPYAREAYRRMGQHLGHEKTVNTLRRYLEARGLDVESCSYRFVAHGPIFAEVASRKMDDHLLPRNEIGALEKALAGALKAAGYDVMNEVKWPAPLNEELFAQVRAAFAAEFPALP